MGGEIYENDITQVGTRKSSYFSVFILPISLKQISPNIKKKYI